MSDLAFLTSHIRTALHPPTSQSSSQTQKQQFEPFSYHDPNEETHTITVASMGTSFMIPSYLRENSISPEISNSNSHSRSRYAGEKEEDEEEEEEEGITMELARQQESFLAPEKIHSFRSRHSAASGNKRVKDQRYTTSRSAEQDTRNFPLPANQSFKGEEFLSGHKEMSMLDVPSFLERQSFLDEDHSFISNEQPLQHVFSESSLKSNSPSGARSNRNSPARHHSPQNHASSSPIRERKSFSERLEEIMPQNHDDFLMKHDIDAETVRDQEGNNKPAFGSFQSVRQSSQEFEPMEVPDFDSEMYIRSVHNAENTRNESRQSNRSGDKATISPVHSPKTLASPKKGSLSIQTLSELPQEFANNAFSTAASSPTDSLAQKHSSHNSNSPSPNALRDFQKDLNDDIERHVEQSLASPRAHQTRSSSTRAASLAIPSQHSPARSAAGATGEQHHGSQRSGAPSPSKNNPILAAPDIRPQRSPVALDPIDAPDDPYGLSKLFSQHSEPFSTSFAMPRKMSRNSVHSYYEDSDADGTPELTMRHEHRPFDAEVPGVFERLDALQAQVDKLQAERDNADRLNEKLREQLRDVQATQTTEFDVVALKSKVNVLEKQVEYWKWVVTEERTQNEREKERRLKRKLRSRKASQNSVNGIETSRVPTEIHSSKAPPIHNERFTSPERISQAPPRPSSPSRSQLEVPAEDAPNHEEIANTIARKPIADRSIHTKNEGTTRRPLDVKLKGQKPSDIAELESHIRSHLAERMKSTKLADNYPTWRRVNQISNQASQTSFMPEASPTKVTKPLASSDPIMKTNEPRRNQIRTKTPLKMAYEAPVPFAVGKSTGASHSLPVKIQQMHQERLYQRPINNAVQSQITRSRQSSNALRDVEMIRVLERELAAATNKYYFMLTNFGEKGKRNSQNNIQTLMTSELRSCVDEIKAKTEAIAQLCNKNPQS